MLLLAGCSGAEAATDLAPEAPPALLDVWTGLDGAFAGREPEGCDLVFGTWAAGFGVRGLACAAAQVVTPTTLAERAGDPFVSGPHTAYGFWLRRRAGGTLPLWDGGLRRLLQTYDAAWLAS